MATKLQNIALRNRGSNFDSNIHWRIRHCDEICHQRFALLFYIETNAAAGILYG